jgi:hypothetical protein
MSEGPALRLQLEPFARYYGLLFEVCFDVEILVSVMALVLLITHHSLLITFSELCLIG